MVSAFQPPTQDQRLDDLGKSHPLNSDRWPPSVSYESETEDEEVKINCIGGVQPYSTTDDSDSNCDNEEDDSSSDEDDESVESETESCRCVSNIFLSLFVCLLFHSSHSLPGPTGTSLIL